MNSIWRPYLQEELDCVKNLPSKPRNTLNLLNGLSQTTRNQLPEVRNQNSVKYTTEQKGLEKALYPI